jgi:hypothetical protein
LCRFIPSNYNFRFREHLAHNGFPPHGSMGGGRREEKGRKAAEPKLKFIAEMATRLFILLNAHCDAFEWRK